HLVRNPQDSQGWVDYGNLLWGDRKPLLAKIAYERAIALNPHNASAMNNRGVVILESEGEEDWYAVAQAQSLIQAALKQEELFVVAKYNRAELLNYYRLFAKSKPLWEQVIVKIQDQFAQDGWAIALQGAGNIAGANVALDKSVEAGAKKSRFAMVFHHAAQFSLDPAKAPQCLDRLEDLDFKDLRGFEKTAADNLRKACQKWKSTK
ncbi:MAG: tetratricopeptide repeat protein, partial [Bdellovibrionota bacterium]